MAAQISFRARALRGRALGRLALGLVLASLAGSCFAQWVWRDENGHPVYSDMPPPVGTPPSSILQQPNSPLPVMPRPSDPQADPGSAGQPPQGQPQAPAQQPGQPPQGQAAPPPPQRKTWSELDADFRKRQEDKAKASAEAEQKQAEATRKAEQCSRARANLATLEQGTRMLRPDESGERHFMDETERTNEVNRMKEEVARNC